MFATAGLLQAAPQWSARWVSPSANFAECPEGCWPSEDVEDSRAMPANAMCGPFVEAIRPDVNDYCVLKLMHSAFNHTPLEVLLNHLGVSSLVLPGIATNSCILCTAHDANMRDLAVSRSNRQSVSAELQIRPFVLRSQAVECS